MAKVFSVYFINAYIMFSFTFSISTLFKMETPESSSSLTTSGWLSLFCCFSFCLPDKNEKERLIL